MIDDHALLRNGLGIIINSFTGFEVTIQAKHGKEFIELMSSHHKPDIVLLDINMPVMNGYDTAKWIHKHLPGTKILVLSMLNSDYVFIRMLRLGARGFLIKDSKPDQFNKALIQIRDFGYYMNENFSSRNISSTVQDSEDLKTLPPQLSEKELEFLKLACTEMTYREIAEHMKVSIRTVDSYRDALFNKLNVSNRVGLVLYAIKNGIVMI